MQFRTLDLIRYGHFTDRSIDFRADAALHIVYGPNEAGKSSALSAFSDLLFGFPERDVGYDFLHDAKDLRIGATVEARNSSELSFRRRKGRKNTLLSGEDGADTPLNDDALAAYLGNLNRTVFERAFGLDSGRLRTGADEMLSDGGEIGQMLFSAASGLTGLKTVSGALAAEADVIYRPKGRIQTLNQAMDRHEAARKSERSLELNASDWKSLLKEENELEGELKTRRDRQYTRRSRSAELERLQLLRGLLQEIDRHEAGLAAFSDLDLVSDDVGTQLQELHNRLTKLSEENSLKSNKNKELTKSLNALTVNDALLKRRSDISLLHGETGLYSQSRKNLPQREIEMNHVTTSLGGLAMQLGLVGVEEFDKSLPSDILRSELNVLLEDGFELQQQITIAQDALSENQQALATLERENESANLIDPAPLKRQLDALQPELAKLDKEDVLNADIAAQERALVEDAGALSPPVMDILGLSRAALPNLAELSRARDKVNLESSYLDTADDLIARTRTEHDNLTAAIDIDQQDGPILTRDDIDVARRNREILWQVLSTEAGNKAAYLNAVTEADVLADRALDNAERVSRHADNLKRLKETAVRLEQAEVERKQCITAHENELNAFRSLFAVSGLEPGTPDEMIDWLRQIEGLLQKRTVLLGLKDQQMALARTKSDIRAGLVPLAELAEADLNMPVTAVSRLIKACLERLDEKWDSARKREGQLSAARQMIGQKQAEIGRLSELQEAFSVRFVERLRQFCLDDATSLVAAKTALELWGRVPALMEQRNRLQQEIAFDNDRTKHFETKVAEVVNDVASDLADEPPVGAVQQLVSRAEVQADRATRRTTLQENAETLARDLEILGDDMGRCQAEIAAISDALPPGILIDGLCERLSQRTSLGAELAEARRRFTESSYGVEEAATRTLAEGLDIIACRQEIEALEIDEQDDVDIIDKLLDQRASCRHRREKIMSGKSAEQAAFERGSAETEARALAREWVILKLAGRLLDGAVERFREGQADPILDAAAAHLKLLTRGTFDGLVLNYGDNDKLVPTARRADGQYIFVHGLSDGTRDQLYLSLRLAFLEDYSSRNEPAPLIVDDIFQTFDDERSAAGLHTLAGLDGIQTILFTHEASLVEIARTELGARADIIQL